MTELTEIKTAADFCKRLKEKKSVSRLKVKLVFSWDAMASEELKKRLANLTEADLTWADLTGANLTGADLTGADLTGADLTWANLTGADLTGADLTGANLTDANLTWAKGKFIFNFGVKLQVVE